MKNPFAPPPHSRDQARQLRARLPAPVTLVTAVDVGSVPARTAAGEPNSGPSDPLMGTSVQVESGAEGWTVSSLLIAQGDPAQAIMVLDPDADVFGALVRSGRFAVSLLDWHHRQLADGFARVGPAPGGVFRLGSFRSTPYGPVLVDAVAWCGALVCAPPEPVGYGVLIRGAIDEIHFADSKAVTLGYLRGRYRKWESA